jgi:hypothetical protein
MLRKLLIAGNYLHLWIFLPFWIAGTYANEAMTPAELERWFQQEELSPTETVSEGELRFLVEPPAKSVLHSLNVLTVFPTSLDDGWVALSQCYQNLDPVVESEVVYRYKSMRDLKIVKYKNIFTAQIKGQSIQLTEVKKEAELCVSAMVRIFYSNPDGSYSLVNGPFHRKFLDGYFPYHLTLEVVYTMSRLKVKHIIPAEQPGFSVKQDTGKLVLDGIFEGILNVEIVFQSQ